MSGELFILSGPYSGSTLLHGLLATSRSVSTLPSEGQSLSELADIMTPSPWETRRSIDWVRVAAVWRSHWISEKPIHLEKSPPHVMHAKEMQAAFPNARFIVLTRHPVATAEGLTRRNGWSIERAARFSGRVLRLQNENRKTLDRVFSIRYEDLVSDPEACCKALLEFVPELDSLDFSASFDVHSVFGRGHRPIQDMNTEKFSRMPADEFAKAWAILEDDFADELAAWDYPAPRRVRT